MSTGTEIVTTSAQERLPTAPPPEAHEHLAQTWRPWGMTREERRQARQRAAQADPDDDGTLPTAPADTGPDDPDDDPDGRPFAISSDPLAFDPVAPGGGTWSFPVLSESETRHILRSLFALSRKTLADLTPQRLKVAWRLVRQIAAFRGMLEDDEMLLSISDKDWRRFSAANTPAPWGLRAAFEKHDIGPLPPRIPQELRTVPNAAIESGQPGYDPRQDEALVAYVQALVVIAKNLGIEDGAPRDPLYGMSGLQGLLDLWLVRSVFPGRMALAAFEEALVEHSARIYVKGGQMALMRRLESDHGLTHAERLRVLKMVRGYAARQVQSDVDTDRALHVLRLEDFIRRSRRALDKRAEISGLKQLAIVQGIARAEPNDLGGDFTLVVRNMGGRPLAPLPPNLAGALPPPGQVRRVEEQT